MSLDVTHLDVTMPVLTCQRCGWCNYQRYVVVAGHRAADGHWIDLVVADNWWRCPRCHWKTYRDAAATGV